MMSVSEEGIELYKRKTLNVGEGGGGDARTGRRSRRRRDGKCNGSQWRREVY